MRKIATLFVALLAIFALNLQGQNAWINEIHYDNTSSDVDETVEIVIENPGSWTLASFQVDLYNGSSSSGASYDARTLDNFTVGNTVGNFTIYYFNYTANGSSIQNGGPDGIALSYGGTLISGQFLSYEGSFTGVGGPADGVTSSDIGVSETSSTPVGESLQLTGNGTSYSAFSWLPPATATSGALNNGQTFSGGPLPEPSNYPTWFIANDMGNMIEVSWTDATGAQLPTAYIVYISEQNNFVAPVDGTPVDDDLDISDGAGAKNVSFGNQAYTFENLASNTLYYFTIYPYTNGGALIDYKTDGAAPTADATTTMVLLYEDFDWSWMAWDTISDIGDEVWVLDPTYGMGGTPCAKISGYNGGAQANEDWLISPPMNLDAYTGENLTFYTAQGYSGGALEVKYSTTYDGTGNPASFSWTDLTATLSPGSWAWTASGDIDLSGISGSNVFIAFKYFSDAAGAATWEIDNILVTAATGPDPADIVINEIQYNTPGTDEEWIELYNNSGTSVNVSGWFVQDSDPTHVPIAIPAGTVLTAGQYYTISIESGGSFPFTPDLDGTLQATWSLGNGGDDVKLFNLGRMLADDVPYSDDAPWPTEPDGNGPSLSLLDPDLDNSMGENWAASLQTTLGSPGAENFPPVPTIIVTSPSGGEAWEQGSMHDITWSTIVYSGQIKIELVDTNTWAPQLLVSNIASSLETWTWTIMSGQAVGDDYIIRISDLGDDPVGESPNTFSITAPWVPSDIVITEIMYNPPESGNDSLEFIELYNNGTVAVDLDGYEFNDGIEFIFPSVTLNPAEYLLVGINATAMMNTFGVMAYEWTSGALSNGGELIQLVDNMGMFVDSVHYDDHLPWDSLADGTGPSLTLCDPSVDNGLAENWVASTEYAAMNSAGDSIWCTPLAGCLLVNPTANFEAVDTTIMVGATADFLDLSTGGSMIAWAWTFEGGDPATSTDQNPMVTYATEGSFDVTLEVENEFGLFSTLTKVDYITTGYAPVADFEADATNPAVGQGVNFTDLSTGTITEWSWEFESGDPATSMLENPVGITWAMVGLYDVTLTVSNEFGGDQMVKADYIDVHPIGITEFAAGELIKIYPNPSNGILNVENTSGEEINISIYSLTGQKMFESRIQVGSEVINLNNADAGIYFIRYFTESGLLKTGKLIIK